MNKLRTAAAITGVCTLLTICTAYGVATGQYGIAIIAAATITLTIYALWGIMEDKYVIEIYDGQHAQWVIAQNQFGVPCPAMSKANADQTIEILRNTYSRVFRVRQVTGA